MLEYYYFWTIMKINQGGCVTTKILAVFNQAGGVAKTTCTMNLGYHLAKKGQRVLLVDMDPQGSLTNFMGRSDGEIKIAVDSLLGDAPLPIVPNVHGMDLVCADIRMCKAEVQLISEMMREFRLRDALEPVKNNYDFILIDCPPTLGILSFISLVAATHVIIPVETNYKALIGIELMCDTIATVIKRPNRGLKVGAIIPTKYNASTNQGNFAIDTMKQDVSALGPITNPIPLAIAFSDASQAHIPLALYDPKHRALSVLDEISQHLIEM